MKTKIKHKSKTTQHVDLTPHSLPVVSRNSQVHPPDLCCRLCPQCATVTWLGRASSRRRASTSAQPTTSVCTARGATAATASSRGRWSRLWDAPTTPSASSAASAGNSHTHIHTRTCTQLMLAAVFRYYLLATDEAKSQGGTLLLL